MENWGDALGKLPTVDFIRDLVNNAYDDLFHYDSKGGRHAFVCTFCDEYILSRHNLHFIRTERLKEVQELFQWKNHTTPAEYELLQPLVDVYKFRDIDNHFSDYDTWLNGMCLSPRGITGRKSKDWHIGFSSCTKCKTWISRRKLPFYAIVNRNFVGYAPECLKILTEVELAFLSPVKGYGYCFSFVGGAQKCLKGSMTFMRVEERSIVSATAQLQGMGLANHIVILMNGKMTSTQKQRANQVVRVDKIRNAVRWLCKNHSRWNNINYDEYERKFETFVPVVIDKSEEVASINQNVEREELFSCYFPDGAVNTHQGGWNDPNDFKAFVQDLHRNGFNIEVQANLSRDFVKGGDGDQLISSCLLQFPYGIGGIDEQRKLPNNTSTEHVYFEPFMAHLTLLSQPEFQYAMFQLVVYSMCSKLWILRKSRLQLRNDRTVNAISNELDADSVAASVRGRQTGNRFAGTAASRALLQAVDATSAALPHSNEAAKSARSQAESMQHVLGTPSIFLTVTFDDENSSVMQVLHGDIIDDDRNVDDVSDAELTSRSQKRRVLRLKHPGLGALTFEMLLEIVAEKVIGWSMRDNLSMDEPGLFGTCEGLVAAVEEQGRHTVHVHFSIWIKGFSALRQQLFFGSKAEKRSAAKLIPKYSDRIASTELIGKQKQLVLKRIFDHENCKLPQTERSVPQVIDDQGLRNLRHRLGYSANSRFAYCAHCDQEWTVEEFIAFFYRKRRRIDEASDTDLESQGTIFLNKSRLHAECISFQNKRHASVQDTPTFAINAAYNSHSSSHVRGCFRCQKRKRGTHKCGTSHECECRFRLPDCSRSKACIRFVKEVNRWFMWNGDEKQQPIIEILHARHPYDAFQNVSCLGVSDTKYACNSNVAVITDGPVGQYTIKYIMKSTQADDTAAYSLVEQSMKSMTSRLHEDDVNEANRRILRAFFAHTNNNVIGPSLASYITRHRTRFYLSHTFQYCPLRDLIKLLMHEKVSSRIVYTANDDDPYVENYAYHYLCRPVALEHCSPRTFFENYCIEKMTKTSKNGIVVMPFIETLHFKHPSVATRGESVGTCRQGVRERETPVDIQVSQWSFQDTAQFKNNIFNCDMDDVNSAMEDYALTVLALFHSYRCKSDLQPPAYSGPFPYVTKLREIYSVEFRRCVTLPTTSVFSDRNTAFLQNIQTCAYNSLRYSVGEDDLASKTHCFQPTGDSPCVVDDINDNINSDDDNNDDTTYELLMSFTDYESTHDTDPDGLTDMLSDFKLLSAQRHQPHNRGIPVCTVDTSFLNGAEWISDLSLQPSTHPTTPHIPIPRREYTVRDIVTVLLHRTVPSDRSDVFTHNPTTDICAANGTAASISTWATAASLDNIQIRAFSAILASFLLTFHDFQPQDYNDPVLTQQDRLLAQRTKNQLMTMKGGNGYQLILLLHGPGGSGKSTVISLVLAYAKEYCTILGHPFSTRTIVVTALSGVAATLIHGSTTHAAMGLLRGTPTSVMIEEWNDTRLLIIDECSFGSSETITTIEHHARILKLGEFEYYGGLSLVYAGDFSQLEPPGQSPLYHNGGRCLPFHDALNSYIELDGRHRFNDDPEFGDIMFRFRDGTVTIEDIRHINEHAIIRPGHMPEPNVAVACHYNRIRDMLNSTGFFNLITDSTNDLDSDNLFPDAVMVLMDKLCMKDGASAFVPVTSNSVKNYFYRTCSENDCNTKASKKGRVDPVLKLYQGCPMMLTTNTDVLNGQANGSRVRFVSIQIIPGKTPMLVSLPGGTKVRVYFASQIATLTVQHEVPDIVPRQFDIKAISSSFHANMVVLQEKRSVSMKGHQFPLISNSATTGHKLQGCTVKELVVYENYYGQNWMYVTLSRVRTLKGLYLVNRLSEDMNKYAMSDNMKNMIADFDHRIKLPPFTEQQLREFSTTS